MKLNIIFSIFILSSSCEKRHEINFDKHIINSAFSKIYSVAEISKSEFERPLHGGVSPREFRSNLRQQLEKSLQIHKGRFDIIENSNADEWDLIKGDEICFFIKFKSIKSEFTINFTYNGNIKKL